MYFPFKLTEDRSSDSETRLLSSDKYVDETLSQDDSAYSDGCFPALIHLAHRARTAHFYAKFLTFSYFCSCFTIMLHLFTIIALHVCTIICLCFVCQIVSYFALCLRLIHV